MSVKAEQAQTSNFGWGSMTALDDDTLAYLTKREGEDEHGLFWQLGVIGHGPPRR